MEAHSDNSSSVINLRRRFSRACSKWVRSTKTEGLVSSKKNSRVLVTPSKLTRKTSLKRYWSSDIFIRNDAKSRRAAISASVNGRRSVFRSMTGFPAASRCNCSRSLERMVLHSGGRIEVVADVIQPVRNEIDFFLIEFIRI